MKIFKLLTLLLVPLCCLTSCDSTSLYRETRNTIRIMVADLSGRSPVIKIQRIAYERPYTKFDLELWCRSQHYICTELNGGYKIQNETYKRGRYLEFNANLYEFILPHYIEAMSLRICTPNDKYEIFPKTQPGKYSFDQKVVEEAKKSYSYAYLVRYLNPEILRETQDPYTYDFRISTIFMQYSLEGKLGDILEDTDTYYHHSYYQTHKRPVDPEGYTFQYYSTDPEGKDIILNANRTFEQDTLIYAYCTKNK